MVGWVHQSYHGWVYRFKSDYSIRLLSYDMQSIKCFLEKDELTVKIFSVSYIPAEKRGIMFHRARELCEFYSQYL